MSRTASAAPIERTYAALIHPDALTVWLPPNGMTCRIERFESRPGVSYRSHRRRIGARWLHATPSSRRTTSVATKHRATAPAERLPGRGNARVAPSARPKKFGHTTGTTVRREL